jgi:branched-chain amino acid aminotransferase
MAIAEGPTENFALVSEKGELLVPDFSRILRGVTLVRVMEMAERMREEFKAVRACTFMVDDIAKAKEAFMVGTTLDVIPVVKFDHHTIGSGKPGPLGLKLKAMLEQDIAGERVLGLETLAVEI